MARYQTSAAKWLELAVQDVGDLYALSDIVRQYIRAIVLSSSVLKSSDPETLPKVIADLTIPIHEEVQAVSWTNVPAVLPPRSNGSSYNDRKFYRDAVRRTVERGPQKNG